MEEIAQHIQSYFGINHADYVKISDFFVKKKLKKGDFLIRQGKFHCNLSFINSGYIRIYNVDQHSHKEITQWISSPNTFTTDLSCLFFGTAAKRDFQAITDCEVATISQDNYKQIGSYINNWEHLEKLFMAKCFNTLEDRIYSHLSMSSEERYKMFFQYNPEIFNHVPLQYIASMLGMTPETLSRIRKKLTS